MLPQLVPPSRNARLPHRPGERARSCAARITAGRTRPPASWSPRHAENHYGDDELLKEEFGLIPAAQIAQIQGLWFGTWDAGVRRSTSTWATWRSTSISCSRTDGGLEVVGAPQVWEVDTAWKFSSDNFTDNYHVFSTHHSLVDLGMLPNDPDFASHGHMIMCGNGHILHMVQGPPDDEEFGRSVSPTSCASR